MEGAFKINPVLLRNKSDITVSNKYLLEYFDCSIKNIPGRAKSVYVSKVVPPGLISLIILFLPYGRPSGACALHNKVILLLGYEAPEGRPYGRKYGKSLIQNPAGMILYLSL